MPSRSLLRPIEGQADKTGRPFFEHCQRVALLVSGDETRTVAYIHDVVEKGSGVDARQAERRLSGDHLRSKCFDTAADEPDDDFVRRAASNPLALSVRNGPI